jgi:3-oxoadipate enol-lactonase
VPIVPVNGAQVFIDDTATPADRPDAPTIVFGHGLLMSGRMFATQVERLRPRFRCVTIDWRGQGRSPAAEHGYDMDTLTRDAVAVIERLDAGAVHYVGLSMGGFVGMRLAARHPALLRSLVLLNTSAGPEDPAKVGRYRLLARVYGVVGVGPLRSQVEPILFGPTYRADPATKRQRDEWVAQVGAVKRSGMKKAIYGVTDRDRSPANSTASPPRHSWSPAPTTSPPRSRCPKPSPRRSAAPALRSSTSAVTRAPSNSLTRWANSSSRSSTSTSQITCCSEVPAGGLRRSRLPRGDR